MSNIAGIVLATILLFLPAYIANMSPVIMYRLNLFRPLFWPLDNGKTLGGERILGDHKTFGGVVAAMVGGAIGGIIIMFLLSYIMRFDSGNVKFGWAEIWKGIYQGGWLGFGAILGDALKSFFKRRLKIKPGSVWPFFDQVDFIVGSWIFSLLIYEAAQTWPMFICAILITPPLHLLSNLVAFKLGWKKVWW